MKDGVAWLLRQEAPDCHSPVRFGIEGPIDEFDDLGLMAQDGSQFLFDQFQFFPADPLFDRGEAVTA